MLSVSLHMSGFGSKYRTIATIDGRASQKFTKLAWQFFMDGGLIICQVGNTFV